jgi:hypothetical protein
MTTSTPAACALCGREPAIQAAIRRHVGMILVQRFFKVREPLCRDCGTRLVRDWTLKTLWQGWWGYISFFVNWFVIGANLVALARLRRLDPPQLSSPLDFDEPATEP